LSRDRCDCANSFGESQNQRGWSGLITHALRCSRIMARLVAPACNGCSGGLRTAQPAPGTRREALTGRQLPATAGRAGSGVAAGGVELRAQRVCAPTLEVAEPIGTGVTLPI
jgi:hypothetical protein